MFRHLNNSSHQTSTFYINDDYLTSLPSSITSNHTKITSQNATDLVTQLPNAVALFNSTNFKIIDSLVGIFGFLLNSFVVVALLCGGRKSKGSVANHLSSSNFHVCCQSTVDSIVGLILFFTTIFEDDGEPHYNSANIGNQILCRVWLSKCFLWAGYACSTYCVLSLNFERYVAIVHPIFHRTKFARNRMYSVLTLSVALLIGGGYNICYIPASAMILPDGRCTTFSVFPSEFVRKFVGFLTFFFLFFTPLVVIIVLYTRMILVLHKRVAPKNESDVNRAYDENVDDTEKATGETNTNMKASSYADQTLSTNKTVVSFVITTDQFPSTDFAKQKEILDRAKKQKNEKNKSSMERARDSVFKTSALLSLSFIICWSWNQIYYFMFQLGVPGCELTGSFYDFTVFMIFVNCIAYPIIFLMKYEPVQKNVKRLMNEIKNMMVKVN